METEIQEDMDVDAGETVGVRSVLCVIISLSISRASDTGGFRAGRAIVVSTAVGCS